MQKPWLLDHLIDIACSEDHSAVAAAAEIANRLEGMAMLRLEVNNIIADLTNRSDDELRYHSVHDDAWPEDRDVASVGPENGQGN